MHTPRTALLTAVVLATLTLDAHAQIPTTLVFRGAGLGAPGTFVVGLGAVATNALGGHAILLSTGNASGPGETVWGSPTPGVLPASLVSPAPAVAGYAQDRLLDGFGLSDAGSVTYLAKCTDLATMVGDLDAVWVDATPILVEGQAPLTEPFLRAGALGSVSCARSTGEPVWIGQVTTTVGTPVGQRLYRGAGHEILMRTGIVLPSTGATVEPDGLGPAYAVSDSGEHFVVTVATNLPAEHDTFVVVDGAVATSCRGEVLGEGEPVSAAQGGLPGETWTAFEHLAINDAGDFLVAGRTNETIARDDVFTLNGSVVLREGDLVPDTSGALHGLIGPVKDTAMSEAGDVLLVWSIAPQLRDVVLLNGTIVLAEGDTLDIDGDGILDPGYEVASIDGPGSLGLGPRIGGGTRLFVRVELTVPMSTVVGSAWVRLDAPALAPLGSACGPYASVCSGDGGDLLGCTDCPCGNDAPQGTIGGCIHSAGGSTRLVAAGHASVSLPPGTAGDLRLAVVGAPPASTSVLVSGAAVAPTGIAHPCSGRTSGIQSIDRDGLRCAVQGLLRHGNRVSNSAGSIDDASGPSRAWGGESTPNAGLAAHAGFVPGQTRWFQVTHRDDPNTVCMRGLNTSQAVQVTFAP